jgi:hypothetical protein
MAPRNSYPRRRVKSFGRQWIRVPKGHTTSWALTYNTCCPLFLPLEREERDEDSMGVVGCRTRLSRSNWSGPEAPGCSLEERRVLRPASGRTPFPSFSSRTVLKTGEEKEGKVGTAHRSAGSPASLGLKPWPRTYGPV